MKAFLAIKYYDDMRNKNLIEEICKSLEFQKFEVFAFARNVQKYGPCNLSGAEVMEKAFYEIKSSNVFVIDASELSVGIGVEAGVAYSNNIPIYLVAKNGVYVSESIKGIAKKSFFYNEPCEIKTFKIF